MTNSNSSRFLVATPRRKTPEELPLFFPAGTWQTDCFLCIVHGQKEGQQRRKIPGIREASRESGDDDAFIISTFSTSHPQSTFQNILSPQSSIPQDYHVTPIPPLPGIKEDINTDHGKISCKRVLHDSTMAVSCGTVKVDSHSSACQGWR